MTARIYFSIVGQLHSTLLKLPLQYLQSFSPSLILSTALQCSLLASVSRIKSSSSLGKLRIGRFLHIFLKFCTILEPLAVHVQLTSFLSFYCNGFLSLAKSLMKSEAYVRQPRNLSSCFLSYIFPKFFFKKIYFCRIICPPFICRPKNSIFYSA